MGTVTPGAKWLKVPNLDERLGMQVRADEALAGFWDVTSCKRDKGTEYRGFETDETGDRVPACASVPVCHSDNASLWFGFKSYQIGHTKFRSRETDTSRTSNHR